MQRMKSSIAMLIVSLFAVGALTFGASELLAANAASACFINPPSELGECSTDRQCQEMCDVYNGTGDCANGCCGCMTR